MKVGESYSSGGACERAVAKVARRLDKPGSLGELQPLDPPATKALTVRCLTLWVQVQEGDCRDGDTRRFDQKVFVGLGGYFQRQEAAKEAGGQAGGRQEKIGAAEESETLSGRPWLPVKRCSGPGLVGRARVTAGRVTTSSSRTCHLSSLQAEQRPGDQSGRVDGPKRQRYFSFPGAAPP
jgi:hypothetical protein